MNAARRFVPLALLLLLALPLPSRAESSEDRASPDPDHERIEDVEARMAARRVRRLGPDGTIAPDAVLRARRDLESRGLPKPSAGRLGAQQATDAGIWNWTWLGPDNIGGRVRALVIHPYLTQIMWAGTAGGGIWRTTDGGANWYPMSDFLPTLPVASMAIDPIDPTILYAGTGELVGSNSSIPGAGIFKSTDSGVTWTQLPATTTSWYQYVSTLAIRPASTGHILAGTTAGLFRSDDGGGIWTRIFYPSNGAAVRNVRYNPANSSIIAVGTATDLYLSKDGGFSFVQQSTGDPGKIPLSPGDCTVEFAPTNTNIIYAQFGRDVPFIDDLTDPIYRSTDGGDTWSVFAPTNADRWSNALWVSPTDPNVVIWGGFGDLRKTLTGDAGYWISDWTQYDAGISAHGDQHAIVSHPNYNGTTNRIVFVANDGGVQKIADVNTVNVTTGWSQLNHGLGCSQFFSGAVSGDGLTVVGGMQDMGSALGHPGPGNLSWTHVAGGDGTFCAIDPTNPQRIFVTGSTMWVQRSDDGGVTFNPKNTGLFGPGQGNEFDFLAPLVMDPVQPATLYAGGKCIWKTVDAADHWVSVRDSIFFNPVVTAIDVCPASPNYVWVGYSNGLVSVSANGGGTWTDHVFPVYNAWITDLAVSPANPFEAVVTIGGNVTNNVWFTSDGGTSWQQRNGTPPYDLPAIQVNTVRYHPWQPNWLYLGTDMGVFASEDKGLTWSVTPAMAGNEGPNNVEVDELFWQGGQYLFAATHGRGIYRCEPLPVVYVDKNYLGVEDGTATRPFKTVSAAVSAYGPGAIISVKSNTYGEPPIILDKRGWVQSTNGSSLIQ